MRAQTYDEFVQALNEKGFFLFFSRQPRGLLRLSDLTIAGAWFSGGDDDPWEWRIRLVEERDGVYAHILGGQGMMISWAWYPLFLAAYRECDTLRERYEAGLVSAPTWKMYAMFQENEALARHDLTNSMRRAEAEKGLRALQREMYITVSGEAQRLTAQMKPVGWPSMEYMRVDVWAREALKQSQSHDRDTARRQLRERAAQLSPNAPALYLDQLFEVGK